jgi:hypothetical protein
MITMGQTVIKHAQTQEGTGVLICTHGLTRGRASSERKGLIMMDRMRADRRDFRRGMAYGYLPRRAGGRTVLPLIAL